MLASAAASQRVRCRQIAEGDFDDLAELLTEGFPVTSKSTWQKGLDRLASLPVIEGLARFGYALENGVGLAGAILNIVSRRGDAIVSNVSGWYVRPSYRAHSTMLVSIATRQKDVIYVNASPSPHTWRTLEATGWKPYNFGRSAAFPLLDFRGGRIHTNIPQYFPRRRCWKIIAVGAVSASCANRMAFCRPLFSVLAGSCGRPCP